MVSQAFGYSVTLVCAVEAFPPADISWSHQSILKSDNEDNLSIDNGRSEEDDNKSVYRGILGGDGFTSSTLRVNRLRPEDLGAYTCTANNKLGRTTHIITVRTSEISQGLNWWWIASLFIVDRQIMNTSFLF